MMRDQVKTNEDLGGIFHRFSKFSSQFDLMSIAVRLKKSPTYHFEATFSNFIRNLELNFNLQVLYVQLERFYRK